MAGGLDGVLPLVPNLWYKRSQHSKYLNDPVLWAEEYLGIHVWRAQREIMYAVRDCRATAVAAGHGVGKTFIVGVIACWWIDVHPLGSSKTFVASTAPSKDQVDLLWDNIRNIHQLAQQRYERKLVDHALPGYITGDNRWKLPNGDTIGQGRKPPDNKSDVAFQGRHADYLLAIGDEAVGLTEGFLNALGVIATGQYNRQVIIANPTDPTSAMAKIWRSKNTKWKTMHISVMDSPRISPEEGWDNDWAPGLSGWEFVEQALEDYGDEDDPRYIARVLGQWAFDAGNNMFTEVDLATGRNTYVLPDPAERPELGLDIARGEKDETVIYRMQIGDVWECDPETGKPIKATGERGWKLRKVASWKKAPFTGGTPENLGTSERTHAIMLAEGSMILKYDASGVGQAIKDGLYTLNDYQQGRNGYIWFEVYGQSTTDVDRRQYENARAEQFFRMKRLLGSGTLDIDPADETLQEQLRGIVYEYTTMGRIKIEAKDDMKKRGVKSPDYADAAWYALYDITAMLDPNHLSPGQRTIIDPEYADHGPSNRVGGWREPV